MICKQTLFLSNLELIYMHTVKLFQVLLFNIIKYSYPVLTICTLLHGFNLLLIIILSRMIKQFYLTHARYPNGYYHSR